MYTNFLAFLRLFTNRHEQDVFKKTQGRLTRIYSGLLILFLTVFIVIVITVLYFVILKTQEQELTTLVKQEASFLENYLWENKLGDLRGMDSQEVVFTGANQSFYYVVNVQGELLMGTEIDQRLRPNFLHLVSGGPQTARIEKIQVETFPQGRGKFRQRQESKAITVMIVSQSIFYKSQFIGQLYIGKDITFAYQLFRWLLIVFAALGIVFIGIALFISVKMSKKAMVPISKAFMRQREFVADASHELRTPLSVMFSSIDAMEMTIEPKQGDFSWKLLSSMRQEVKRMTYLVSDLLTLARSDSNTIQLNTELFDFRPLAEKAVESVGPLAAAKQIGLSLEAAGTLRTIGDPNRLAQLLYILLDNAIKYTAEGGTVKLTLDHTGQKLAIMVEDNGIGIKKEEIPHIFERFYRVDKARTRMAGGHGLGLSIAKWIVDTHRGTISVKSAIGKGSSFVIEIPQINLNVR